MVCDKLVVTQIINVKLSKQIKPKIILGQSDSDLDCAYQYVLCRTATHNCT